MMALMVRNGLITRSVWPNLSKRAEAAVRVFLVGDGVVCAKRGQTTPQGYYNVERMLKSITQRGEVAV